MKSDSYPTQLTLSGTTYKLVPLHQFLKNNVGRIKIALRLWPEIKTLPLYISSGVLKGCVLYPEKLYGSSWLGFKNPISNRLCGTDIDSVFKVEGYDSIYISENLKQKLQDAGENHICYDKFNEQLNIGHFVMIIKNSSIKSEDCVRFGKIVRMKPDNVVDISDCATNEIFTVRQKSKIISFENSPEFKDKAFIHILSNAGISPK